MTHLLIPLIMLMSPHSVDAQYGTNASPIAHEILKSVDQIQSRFPDGGGYFMGIKGDPPECPVGFPVDFLGSALVKPTRTTSYCSGASYTVLMLSLSRLVQTDHRTLTQAQSDAIRMQNANGSRREDEEKLWGWWNADGPGSYYALCEYTRMGRRVQPAEAKAGDFVNISWKKGAGHSAIFLGWEKASDGTPGMTFWSSQGSTKGFAKLTVSQDTVADYVFVRLENPSAIFDLDPNKQMKRSDVKPDRPPFPAP